MPLPELLPLKRFLLALLTAPLLTALLLTALPTASAAAPAWRVTIRSDLKELARPKTLTILAVGAVAAGASLLIENPERQAALFEAGTFDGASDVGNGYGSGVTLAALSGVLLGAGHLAHDEGMKRAGSQMARSLAYTGIAVRALKVAFHRTRPNGGAHSFPSGHTATAFAMAPVLASQFGPSVGIPAYLLAGATGMGRMEERKHYLSDVFFGAALGLAVGIAVTGHDGLPARLELSPTRGGATVSYHF